MSTTPAELANQGQNTIFFDPDRVRILFTDPFEINHVEELVQMSLLTHAAEPGKITPESADGNTVKEAVNVLESSPIDRIKIPKEDGNVDNGPLTLSIEDNAYGVFVILQEDAMKLLVDGITPEQGRSSHLSRLMLRKLSRAVIDPRVGEYSRDDSLMPMLQRMAGQFIRATNG